MALARYVESFDPYARISVPPPLCNAASKLDDEGQYMIRCEVPRKSLPPHNIFFFIDGDRYRARLVDEEMDMGALQTVLLLRLWQIHVHNLPVGITKFYMFDSWERTEEEIKCIQEHLLSIDQDSNTE
jgi:hypothetical protein